MAIFRIDNLEVGYSELIQQKEVINWVLSQKILIQRRDAFEGLRNMLEDMGDAIDGEQSPSNNTKAMMISSS